ncbi:acyl-[acyl-carrier-protein] thioesterase [Geovibrio thiophilus]|nr:acyl-ACP thioesterase domain-containing protein [Geovibrio thiophilus]
MKYCTTDSIKINDAGTDGHILPDALFRIFQEAAIKHSDSVGFTHGKYMEMNRLWMLHRLSYRLHSGINLYDTLKTETWSRGMQRFRGFREYELSRNGQRVCTASSVWLFIDTAKKRPAKIEPEIPEAYKPVDETTSGTAIEDWQPEKPSETAESCRIQTRLSDFDINSHLNNTVYSAYIFQAFAEINGAKKDFSEFCIEFSHELPLGTKEALVKIERKGADCVFSVSDGTQTNALGFFRA